MKIQNETRLITLVLLTCTAGYLARGESVEKRVSIRERKNVPSACEGSGWSAGPDMPSTVVRAVGVYFQANGKFYVMGGRASDSPGSDLIHPFEYDPATNSWTTKSATYPDNQVNNMACSVLTDSGTPYIYCVGGSAAGQTTATDRMFRYDPIADTINSIPAPWLGDSDGITLPGGFTVSHNKLYILGGFQINTAATDEIWEFTPGSNSWTLKNSHLDETLAFVPASTIGDLIFTAGGSFWNGTTLVEQIDAFVYDPIADSIQGFDNIPRATAETRALTFDTGSGEDMWVMGGGRNPPNPSNEVDVYDTSMFEWVLGPAFMTARRNFPTDTDGTNTIWLAGGYASDGVTPLSSMEIFCQAGATPSPTPTQSPTVTPTPTATTTPTATATATATPMGTRTPCVACTPRPRPTPAVRPSPSAPPSPHGTPRFTPVPRP